jgi:hypothetical protein
MVRRPFSIAATAVLRHATNRLDAWARRPALPAWRMALSGRSIHKKTSTKSGPRNHIIRQLAGGEVEHAASPNDVVDEERNSPDTGGAIVSEY